MNRTFFAYHLTHYFGPFSLQSYHTNSSQPREGDTVYVVSGDDDEDRTGKDYWLEGIFRIHRRHEGNWSLPSVKGKARYFKYKLSMIAIRVPDKPIPLAFAPWYDRKEIHNFFSSGQNFNPLPAGYKERFDNLLSGYGQAEAIELAEDLADIEKNVTDPTERDALTKARIGQGKFRTEVTAAWRLGEVCPLTGIAIPELLVASHIKPWRDATNRERLDPANGLLLATHVDKLFDRFLLSFRNEKLGFTVELHPRVVQVAHQLGINRSQPLKTDALSPIFIDQVHSYLDGHYKRFLQQIKNDAPTESGFTGKDATIDSRAHVKSQIRRRVIKT